MVHAPSEYGGCGLRATGAKPTVHAPGESQGTALDAGRVSPSIFPTTAETRVLPDTPRAAMREGARLPYNRKYPEAPGFFRSS